MRELQKYERERGELQSSIRNYELELVKLQAELNTLLANMTY